MEIVVETTRRITLRKPGATPATPCELCAGPLLPAELAVTLTGLSSRAIHRLVEAGEVHFAETPAGALLVCPNSFGTAQVPPRRKRTLIPEGDRS